MFKDTVNREHAWKSTNGTIRSSNLCVTGDTRILTKEYGNEFIGKLVEDGVVSATCWNGEEWSETELFKTSHGQRVLTVELSNDIKIYATHYHKWIVVDRLTPTTYKTRILTTKELKPGMLLMKNKQLETIPHGNLEMMHPYENGLFTGDGCSYYDRRKKKTCYILHLYNEKINLVNFITNIRYRSPITTANTNNIRQTLILKDETMYPKFFVPTKDIKLKDRLLWLAGLFDADGCLLNNNGSQSIQICSVNHRFINELYYMLQELGIQAKISKRRDGGYYLLPDQRGGYRKYYCHPVWMLMIPGAVCNKLLELGYKAHRVMPVKHKYNRSATEYIRVKSVTDEYVYAPTYCGDEPKKHTLMFNGQLTKNCSEVTLPTGKNLSGVCNLGSLNLARIIDKEELKRVIKIAMRALDNNIDLTPYPTDATKNFQEMYRSVGLGSLGEAEAIANKQIYYGSDEHKTWIEDIWSTIREYGDQISIELGEEKGFSVNKVYRNSYRYAIAPNSSSAIFAGTTNGIEPVYNKVWVEENKRGSFILTAPHLTTDNFQYYQNPYEVDPLKYIEVNAIRQKYVDMAISMNLFLDPENLGLKQIRDCIVHAWETGVKTIYYLRSKPPKKSEARDGEIVCVGCVN